MYVVIFANTHTHTPSIALPPSLCICIICSAHTRLNGCKGAKKFSEYKAFLSFFVVIKAGFFVSILYPYWNINRYPLSNFSLLGGFFVPVCGCPKSHLAHRIHRFNGIHGFYTVYNQQNIEICIFYFCVNPSIPCVLCAFGQPQSKSHKSLTVEFEIQQSLVSFQVPVVEHPRALTSLKNHSLKASARGKAG